MERAWGLTGTEWTAVAALAAVTTVLIAVIAAVAAVRQLRLAATAAQEAARVSFATATRESMTHLHGILANFITVKGLRPCFYDNVSPGTDLEESVLATAEMLADTIESSLEICKELPEFAAHREDWTKYGEFLWDNSPSIRRVVLEADGWCGDYRAAVDLRVGAEIMCVALQGDPLWGQWASTHDPGRSRALRSLLAGYLGQCRTSGWVTIEDRGAVAAWCRPTSNADPAAEEEQLEKSLGPSAFAEDWPGVENMFKSMSQYRATLEPHMYLEFLGVLPDKQRQGLGRTLLWAGLDWADEASPPLPVYLETANEANVPYYETHGFKVVSTFDAPRGLLVWGMLRGASGGQQISP